MMMITSKDTTTNGLLKTILHKDRSEIDEYKKISLIIDTLLANNIVDKK